MFTGLIREIGTVTTAVPTSGGLTIRYRTLDLWRDVEIGHSVAVDGVCLTVTAVRGPELEAYIMAETISSTCLGRLRAGKRVNLEPALRTEDGLHGHFVLGDVDFIGHIAAVSREGASLRVRISHTGAMDRLLVRKGRVTVDGASLTVADLGPGWFDVCLIPHTQKGTTLGEKGIGEGVNLEADLIGKYVMNKGYNDHGKNR